MALRREVELLLAQQASVEGFLGQPAPAEMISQPPGAMLIGRQIGVYRLVALLGAGLLGAATFAGVILMVLLRASVAYTLPVSAGVTLYVAASDLIPEVNREPGTRIALVVFLGAALMMVLIAAVVRPTTVTRKTGVASRLTSGC